MSNITKLSPDFDEKKYNFTDYDKTLHWVYEGNQEHQEVSHKNLSQNSTAGYCLKLRFIEHGIAQEKAYKSEDFFKYIFPLDRKVTVH